MRRGSSRDHYCGENPDAEELKYEIADFLYHMMVLMAECGLDWNDITKELVNRR